MRQEKFSVQGMFSSSMSVSRGPYRQLSQGVIDGLVSRGIFSLSMKVSRGPYKQLSQGEWMRLDRISVQGED